MTLANDVRLDELDMSDPDLYVNGPPHDIFARLRAEAPVHWTPSGSEQLGHEPQGFWSITRYDDVSRINRDAEAFSSARRSFTIQDGAAFPVEVEHNMFLGMDAPEHTRHRKIIRSVFTPKVIAGREEPIRRTVSRMLDGVIEQGHCDLTQLVARLPLTVTAELVGIPEEDHQNMYDWTNQFSSFDDVAVRSDPEGGLKAAANMGMYVLGRLGELRENPGTDLLSRLLVAEEDGERLTDVEVVADFILLVGGGIETTRNVLVGALVLLDQYRDQRQKLLDDPSLMGNAVEEALRFHSPFMHMARTATREVEVNGVTINEGEKAVLWYVSANRDETANPEPDRFDIARQDIKQVAFGGGGPHQCLGAHLARLEISVFLQEVLRRMPDYEISGPVKRLRSNFIHGFMEAPISFTPGPTEG